jgi:hypothetical protein
VSNGFLIDANIQSAPGSNFVERIFLLHAPVDEQERIDYELNRIKELEQHQKRMLNVAAAEKDYHDKMVDGYYTARIYAPGDPDFDPTATAYAKAANAAEARGRQAEQAAANAGYERENLIKDASPWLNSTNYVLDCFALRTEQNYRGYRIYDVGWVGIQGAAH